MERLNHILNHTKYKEYLRKNQAAEEGRIFCCHSMEHFLDVARIAYIMNLEESLEIDRELIYATALLHDIGRHVQYEDGTPHEEAGAILAEDILKECGFRKVERTLILQAIREHRNTDMVTHKDLAGLLYRADKASRACFACEAEGLCNWKKEKKNMQIKY